jgi:hypothetical protein
LIENFSVQSELGLIQDRITDLQDPADRVLACGLAYDQLTSLIAWLGQYGERGRAAKQAVDLYGAEEAAIRARVTPATINRLAGK